MGITDDKLAIYDTVARYCRAVDRLDYAGIRSVYAPDGVDHHTGFDGTADEYVAWLRTVLPRLDGTMHIIGTHLSEINGDAAVVETYGTAVHWGTPRNDPQRNFTSGFRYLDHMIRGDDRWLIAERFAVREWHRVDAGRLMDLPDGPRGTRDENDPLWELRRRVGVA